MRLTYPRLDTIGNLQKLFDEFPTPGDDFMLQILTVTFSKNSVIQTMHVRNLSSSMSYYLNTTISAHHGFFMSVLKC